MTAAARVHALFRWTTKCSGARSQQASRLLLHTGGGSPLGSLTLSSCMVGRVLDFVSSHGLHSYARLAWRSLHLINRRMVAVPASCARCLISSTRFMRSGVA